MRRPATPHERTVEISAAYLDSALDDIINARLTLHPDVGEWSPPHHALGCAMGDDPCRGAWLIGSAGRSARTTRTATKDGTPRGA